MERLMFDEILKLVNKAVVQMELDNCKECSENYKQIAEYIEELKSYKDLEEQGLFVRLPCKVGTEVFAIFPGINHYVKCQIKKIEIKPNIFEKICYFIEPVVRRGQYLKYFNNEFGETIFLTKEEAEKKLEELKKEQCLM